MVGRRGSLPVFGLVLGLGVLVLGGCSQPKTARQWDRSDLEASLPAEFKGVGGEAWSAQKVVGVKLPDEAQYSDVYANPFGDLSGWSGVDNEPRRRDFLGKVAAWEKEVDGVKEPIDLDKEVVSSEFQRSVGVVIAAARVEMAGGNKAGALDQFARAAAMAKSSLETGPGMEGLNQTVPALLVAQLATELGAKYPDADSKKAVLKGLEEFDFVAVAKKKLQEHMTTDIVPRLVNVQNSPEVPAQAARAVRGPEPEEEWVDFMDSVYNLDKRTFSAKDALAQATPWMTGMIDGLDQGWPAVESVLAERDKALTDKWGIDLFHLKDVDESTVSKMNRDSNAKFMEVLFAYDAVQAAVPILESALVSQMSVDAAKLTVMAAGADAAGLSEAGLAKAFPEAWGSLNDPLSSGKYAVDFKTRTLRSSLTSVAKDNILLGSVVSNGVKF